MRYDVRVSDGSRFNLDRVEPLRIGEVVTESKATYKVTAVQDVEDERFDGIAEVEHFGASGDSIAAST